MKTCNICKRKLSLEAFNKNRRKKDGLQDMCRRCSNSMSKQYYAKNTKSHIKRMVKKKKERLDVLHGIISNFKVDIGCSTCDEKEPVCIDFHHVEDKEFSIANLIKDASITKFISEIQKCTLLCANCHRKHHKGVLGKEPKVMNFDSLILQLRN